MRVLTSECPFNCWVSLLAELIARLSGDDSSKHLSSMWLHSCRSIQMPEAPPLPEALSLSGPRHGHNRHS